MERTILLFIFGTLFIVSSPIYGSIYAQQAIDIKITSPSSGQRVQIGSDLTITGTSIYSSTIDCQVYAGWNGLKPYQKVTAIGPTGENDYSNWIFTYNQKYHSIISGKNVLTAELSCLSNPTNVTKNYNVLVIGVPQMSTNGVVATAENPPNHISSGTHQHPSNSAPDASSPNHSSPPTDHSSNSAPDASSPNHSSPPTDHSSNPAPTPSDSPSCQTKDCFSGAK